MVKTRASLRQEPSQALTKRGRLWVAGSQTLNISVDHMEDSTQGIDPAVLAVRTPPYTQRTQKTQKQEIVLVEDSLEKDLLVEDSYQRQQSQLELLSVEDEAVGSSRSTHGHPFGERAQGMFSLIEYVPDSQPDPSSLVPSVPTKLVMDHPIGQPDHFVSRKHPLGSESTTLRLAKRTKDASEVAVEEAETAPTNFHLPAILNEVADNEIEHSLALSALNAESAVQTQPPSLQATPRHKTSHGQQTGLRRSPRLKEKSSTPSNSQQLERRTSPRLAERLRSVKSQELNKAILLPLKNTKGNQPIKVVAAAVSKSRESPKVPAALHKLLEIPFEEDHSAGPSKTRSQVRSSDGLHHKSAIQQQQATSSKKSSRSGRKLPQKASPGKEDTGSVAAVPQQQVTSENPDFSQPDDADVFDLPTSPRAQNERRGIAGKQTASKRAPRRSEPLGTMEAPNMAPSVNSRAKRRRAGSDDDEDAFVPAATSAKRKAAPRRSQRLVERTPQPIAAEHIGDSRDDDSLEFAGADSHMAATKTHIRQKVKRKSVVKAGASQEAAIDISSDKSSSPLRSCSPGQPFIDSAAASLRNIKNREEPATPIGKSGLPAGHPSSEVNPSGGKRRLPEVDEHSTRKPQIISFNKQGPQNQGRSSPQANSVQSRNEPIAANENNLLPASQSSDYGGNEGLELCEQPHPTPTPFERNGQRTRSIQSSRGTHAPDKSTKATSPQLVAPDTQAQTLRESQSNIKQVSQEGLRNENAEEYNFDHDAGRSDYRQMVLERSPIKELVSKTGTADVSARDFHAAGEDDIEPLRRNSSIEKSNTKESAASVTGPPPIDILQVSATGRYPVTDTEGLPRTGEAPDGHGTPSENPAQEGNSAWQVPSADTSTLRTAQLQSKIHSGAHQYPLPAAHVESLPQSSDPYSATQKEQHIARSEVSSVHLLFDTKTFVPTEASAGSHLEHTRSDRDNLEAKVSIGTNNHTPENHQLSELDSNLPTEYFNEQSEREFVKEGITQVAATQKLNPQPVRRQEQNDDRSTHDTSGSTRDRSVHRRSPDKQVPQDHQRPLSRPCDEQQIPARLTTVTSIAPTGSHSDRNIVTDQRAKHYQSQPQSAPGRLQHYDAGQVQLGYQLMTLVQACLRSEDPVVATAAQMLQAGRVDGQLTLNEQLNLDARKMYSHPVTSPTQIAHQVDSATKKTSDNNRLRSEDAAEASEMTASKQGGGVADKSVSMPRKVETSKSFSSTKPDEQLRGLTCAPQVPVLEICPATQQPHVSATKGQTLSPTKTQLVVPSNVANVQETASRKRTQLSPMTPQNPQDEQLIVHPRTHEEVLQGETRSRSISLKILPFRRASESLGAVDENGSPYPPEVEASKIVRDPIRARGAYVQELEPASELSGSEADSDDGPPYHTQSEYFDRTIGKLSSNRKAAPEPPQSAFNVMVGISARRELEETNQVDPSRALEDHFHPGRPAKQKKDSEFAKRLREHEEPNRKQQNNGKSQGSYQHGRREFPSNGPDTTAEEEDPDRTLVESRRRGRPTKAPGRGQAEESDSSKASSRVSDRGRDGQLSDASGGTDSSAEWNEALHRHHQSIQEALDRVTRRLLRHLVSSEDALQNVVEEYEKDAMRLVRQLEELHWKEYITKRRELDQRKRDLDQVLSQVKMVEKEKRMLENDLREWQQRMEPNHGEDELLRLDQAIESFA